MPATTVITATYNGVNKTATLTSVNATVIGLTCAPNPVIGGNTDRLHCDDERDHALGHTRLGSVGPAVLRARRSGYLTVPAGAVSAAFSIPTTLVPDQIVAHISANALATATVTAPLTINLTNRGRKWNLNNVVFKDGSRATGYFMYDPATGQYLAVNIQVTHANPDPIRTIRWANLQQNLYYYPWPNGYMPTFVNDWSTASLMALQNPVTSGLNIPLSWTLLQFNFAQRAYERGRDNSSGRSIPTCRILRTAPITLRRRARRRGTTSLKSSSRCPITSLMSRQPGTTASSSAGA